MKKTSYALILFIIISITYTSCEKDKSSDCLSAPANFRCGEGGGSICGVYHYSGGIFTGVSLSLYWDEVSDAEGYNVYRKGTSGQFQLQGTTTTTHFSPFQGRGTVIWAVKAYKGDCESGFSNEFESVVSK